MSKYQKLFSFWTPWTLTACLVIIVLAGILIAISIWQSDGSGNYVLDNRSIQSPSTVLAVYRETSTRYTNITSHYAISIPASWQMSGSVNTGYMAFLDPLVLERMTDSELTQGMKIEIVIEKKSRDQTLAQYVTTVNRGFEQDVSGQKDLIVANRPAIQQVSEFIGYIITTYIDRTNSVLQISAIIPQESGREKYLEQYRAMLSSLKLF